MAVPTATRKPRALPSLRVPALVGSVSLGLLRSSQLPDNTVTRILCL